MVQSYCNIPLISPGLIQDRKQGFGWVYKRGGGGLISGGAYKRYEQIRNKFILTYSAIQGCFPFTHVFRLCNKASI